MTDTSIITDAREAEFGDFFELMKPRVMSLVVFTALAGLVIAPVGVHPVLAAASILFIAVGAGASGALNMWWDADIDAVMRRTAGRPVPAGRVTGEDARNLGLGLSMLSVMMLGLTANYFAAGLLAFTIFFYAVIYTMLLKRLTPQNIVIGGAAGAFPPMIGWAVATGGVSMGSVLMFALIFVWTPPHFWSLALFMKDDYTKAGVPMLTVTHGRRETRRQIVIYTAALAVLAVGIGFSDIGGPLYMGVALVLNALFLGRAVVLWRRDESAAQADGYAAEKRFFRLSLVYLFVHFLALMAEAGLDRAGITLIGGW